MEFYKEKKKITKEFMKECPHCKKPIKVFLKRSLNSAYNVEVEA